MATGSWSMAGSVVMSKLTSVSQVSDNTNVPSHMVTWSMYHMHHFCLNPRSDSAGASNVCLF